MRTAYAAVMRALLAAIAAALLAAMIVSPAGAKTHPKPPAASTAQELAGAVQAAGWGCDDFAASTGSITIGNLPKPDQGHCTIDGQRSDLDVYRTKADRAAIIAAVPTVGCSFGKSMGVTKFRFVVGPTWTISTPSSATGPKLAKALHAKVYVHRCSK